MKYIFKKVAFALLMVWLGQSCIGERKKIDLEEMDDTSFVNKKFKGNLIDYKAGMSACDNIGPDAIGKLYGVAPDLVIVDDPVSNPNRRATDIPLCSFFIKSGESDFQWLRGSIALEREIGKNEIMGEIAEATGGGEKWEEAWALKKSMLQSVEWVKDIGMAALWNSKEKSLSIKFDGYTLKVFPPKNNLNALETSVNRDYKKVALALAKAGGYIN